MIPFPEPEDQGQLNETELSAMIEAIRPALRGYILSLLPHPDAVDDVIQETCLFIWERRTDFQQGTNFKAWAFKTGYFKALAYRRSLQRNKVVTLFIDRLLDSQAMTRQEMAHFEELLDDDANLAFYLQQTQLEAALPEAVAAAVERPLPAPRSTRRFMPWTLAAAATVAFFIGLLVGGLLKQPSTPEPVAKTDAPAARITGLMGVSWSTDQPPRLLGSSGAVEEVAIDSGLVEVTYESGVRVMVEGPARYEVRDPESGRLFSGKLVASVPKGAEGFRVDYSNGTIVDLGTEFAMEVKAGGDTEVGVFDGEIELHTGKEKPMALFKDQSVLHKAEGSGSNIEAVPFRRDQFIRRLPSRDFAWELTSITPEELEFDVTHLVWKPASYRAIFKWINGRDAIDIRKVELRRDGRVISTDDHPGTTGFLTNVRDNLYRLDVPSGDYEPGRWTLHVTVEAHPRTGTLAGYTGPVHSSGILQFEEGLATEATASDFVGRWSYHHLGDRYVREFRDDGTVTLRMNGTPPSSDFFKSRWSIEDGVLVVTIPHLNTVEKHILRDPETLIFITNPYENAVRECDG